MSFAETDCKISTDPADLKVIGRYNADIGMICNQNPDRPNIILCRTPESLMMDNLSIACKDGTYNGTKVARLCAWGDKDNVLDECKKLETWK